MMGQYTGLNTKDQYPLYHQSAICLSSYELRFASLCGYWNIVPRHYNLAIFEIAYRIILNIWFKQLPFWYCIKPNWEDYLSFSPLRSSQEIYKKGVRPTVKITKDEAHYLADSGFRWHSSIMHTWSKRKHYYACESRKVLEALEAYRQSQKKD